MPGEATKEKRLQEVKAAKSHTSWSSVVKVSQQRTQRWRRREDGEIRRKKKDGRNTP